MAVHGTACCFASLRIAVLLNRRTPSKSKQSDRNQASRKMKTPRIFAIFLGEFPSCSNNSKHLTKTTTLHQTQNLGAERKKIGGGTGGCDHCGLCLLERFFIVALALPARTRRTCFPVYSGRLRRRMVCRAESAGFRVLVSPGVIEHAETGGS